jgi:predicted nuclease of predicted toxin-antitoxin system
MPPISLVIGWFPFRQVRDEVQDRREHAGRSCRDLRQAGHDALTVANQQLAGQPDVRVAHVCRAEGRALLTLDLDFSDIRVYPPSDYSGIIVLRPSVQTITNIRRLAGQVLAALPTEPLVGHLWIVDEGQIRIRAGTQGTP